MGEKQAVIETDRLRLVPLEAEHADDVVGLFDDPAMSIYLDVDLSKDGLARTMVDNVSSLRVAERLGFLPVGEGFHYDGPHRVHVALPDRV